MIFLFFFFQIMFGPDKCGTSNARTHVIFNYPPKGKGGEDEEGGGEAANLLIKKEVKMEKDQASHLYTLHVKADGTFEVCWLIGWFAGLEADWLVVGWFDGYGYR